MLTLWTYYYNNKVVITSMKSLLHVIFSDPPKHVKNVQKTRKNAVFGHFWRSRTVSSQALKNRQKSRFLTTFVCSTRMMKKGLHHTSMSLHFVTLYTPHRSYLWSPKWSKIRPILRAPREASGTRLPTVLQKSHCDAQFMYSHITGDDANVDNALRN